MSRGLEMHPPVPPTAPAPTQAAIDWAEKCRRFDRFYKGYRDFKSSNPIEPPRAWSPYSRNLYYSGAEAAKRERDVKT